ncbi:unnamed protein product [Toxocara canis]|uniref:DBR1 domain-containing protein n=1 Tax=Toxocara canis TaxID=6265 RepID=A0A183U311_TOXCA|nr:unnamed protein product [Toxocara canis]
MTRETVHVPNLNASTFSCLQEFFPQPMVVDGLQVHYESATPHQVHKRAQPADEDYSHDYDPFWVMF